MTQPGNESVDARDSVTADVHIRSRLRLGRDLLAAPDTIEVNGVLFTRALDQADERKRLAREARWDEVLAYGVPHALLVDLDADGRYATMDEWDAALRRIGSMLVLHGRADLWQLAYLENYTLERGYCVGDEMLFLLRKPTSDQAGYQGPPGPNDRLLSAVEISAAQREP